LQKKGKAYANKKKKEDRPIGDFYSTPVSLLKVASPLIISEFSPHSLILEPCSGEGAISNFLKSSYVVETNDLYSEKATFHEDYLETSSFNGHEQIITNPPFSLWDEFVLKAKTHCKKFMMIGRLNYFGSSGRDVSTNNCDKCNYKSDKFGYCNKYSKPVSHVSDSQCVRKVRLRNSKTSFIWGHLKKYYIFNRYVDYQTPYRKDGLFNVGAMPTAWFLWDMEYVGDPSSTILNVQPWAKLGQFNKQK